MPVRLTRLRMLLVATALAAAGPLGVIGATTAHAYGGGATHDTWQVGLSFNCNNADFCGPDNLGGFWGWAEFDRAADGTITGDAELAGCGHTTGGGGPGTAGAGHISLDITAAHIGSSDPTNGDPPGVGMFYVDHNVVTITDHGTTLTITDDPEFLGDSGIPAVAGHYAFHPVPGIAGETQVAYRPAR